MSGNPGNCWGSGPGCSSRTRGWVPPTVVALMLDVLARAHPDLAWSPLCLSVVVIDAFAPERVRLVVDPLDSLRRRPASCRCGNGDPAAKGEQLHLCSTGSGWSHARRPRTLATMVIWPRRDPCPAPGLTGPGSSACSAERSRWRSSNSSTDGLARRDGHDQLRRTAWFLRRSGRGSRERWSAAPSETRMSWRLLWPSNVRRSTALV